MPGLALGALVTYIQMAPIRATGDRYVFVLPKGTGTVHVVSRSGAPADLRPWLDDRRRLGVSVGRIILRRGAAVTEVPVDHPSLTDGWHAIEHGSGRQWRWTSGRARLPVSVGTRMIELRLAGSTEYLAEMLPVAHAFSTQAG